MDGMNVWLVTPNSNKFREEITLRIYFDQKVLIQLQQAGQKCHSSYIAIKNVDITIFCNKDETVFGFLNRVGTITNI